MSKEKLDSIIISLEITQLIGLGETSDSEQIIDLSKLPLQTIRKP